MKTFIPDFPEWADGQSFEDVSSYSLESSWLIVYTFFDVVVDGMQFSSQYVYFELTTHDLKRLDGINVYRGKERKTLDYHTDEGHKFLESKAVFKNEKYNAERIKKNKRGGRFFLAKDQSEGIVVYDIETKNYKVLNLKCLATKISADGNTVAIVERKIITVMDNPLL